MIREKSAVETKNGRKGVVTALLGWVDNKPQSAAVRFSDDPVYPKEEVVCQLKNLKEI